MAQDNVKRGAASPDQRDAADLFSLVRRVEESDPSVRVLNLSEHRQFLWLSTAQQLRALSQISTGCQLHELCLNSLGLTLTLIEPIAAAVRSHTRLEKLSLERNGLNEAALVTLADAISGQCVARSRTRSSPPCPRGSPARLYARMPS